MHRDGPNQTQDSPIVPKVPNGSLPRDDSLPRRKPKGVGSSRCNQVTNGGAGTNTILDEIKEAMRSEDTARELAIELHRLRVDNRLMGPEMSRLRDENMNLQHEVKALQEELLELKGTPGMEGQEGEGNGQQIVPPQKQFNTMALQKQRSLFAPLRRQLQNFAGQQHYAVFTNALEGTQNSKGTDKACAETSGASGSLDARPKSKITRNNARKTKMKCRATNVPSNEVEAQQMSLNAHECSQSRDLQNLAAENADGSKGEDFVYEDFLMGVL